MMAVMQILVFVGAFALTGFVVAETIVPALPRMRALLRGAIDPALMPASPLVLAPRPRAVTVRKVSLRAPAGWREAA